MSYMSTSSSKLKPLTVLDGKSRNISLLYPNVISTVVKQPARILAVSIATHGFHGSAMIL